MWVSYAHLRVVWLDSSSQILMKQTYNFSIINSKANCFPFNYNNDKTLRLGTLDLRNFSKFFRIE